MNRERIRDVMKAILEQETGQTRPSLDDDAVLAEDFALDSVDLVSLLMCVESQFQVRLTNAELTENRTIGDLIDLVRSKVSEPATGTSAMRAAA